MLQLFDDYIRCLSTGINITHLVVSDEVLGVVIEVADCLHMVQLMPLHPETPSYFASFISRLALLSSTAIF